MEATGRYGEALCLHLFAAGWTLHVINPARVAHYAKSLGVRSKTDAVDAAVIARFCRANAGSLVAWKPAPAPVAALRGLLRRRASLMRVLTAEKNTRAALPDHADTALVRSCERHIGFLAGEIVDLDAAMGAIVKTDDTLRAHERRLRAIKGVGALTALELLAHVLSHDFAKARQCAAHAGVTPAHRQSGTSLNAPSRISRRGDAHIRRALYMPALSMLSREGPMRDWARGLVSRGKAPMAAVCAIMRKLLHIAFGIIKSGKDYDPSLAFSSPAS